MNIYVYIYIYSYTYTYTRCCNAYGERHCFGKPIDSRQGVNGVFAMGIQMKSTTQFDRKARPSLRNGVWCDNALDFASVCVGQ